MPFSAKAGLCQTFKISFLLTPSRAGVDQPVLWAALFRTIFRSIEKNVNEADRIPVTPPPQNTASQSTSQVVWVSVECRGWALLALHCFTSSMCLFSSSFLVEEHLTMWPRSVLVCLFIPHTRTLCIHNVSSLAWPSFDIWPVYEPKATRSNHNHRKLGIFFLPLFMNIKTNNFSLLLALLYSAVWMPLSWSRKWISNSS